MKKIFLLCLAVIMVAFSMISPSCKKITHDTHPTPTNVRLMGYTVTNTSRVMFPSALFVQPVTKNYSFFYDGNNKVSQIYFTTNDSNLVKIGRGSTVSAFTYSGNTIYKTVTIAPASNVIEQDTFITNGAGQITNSYFPWMFFSYAYYGQLMTHETFGYRDSGTAVTGSVTYTSNSGDFLERKFDGNLHATFPDSGIRPMVIFPDTVRDSILSVPLTVTWASFGVGTGPVIVTHTASGYSDDLTGYSEQTISVNAVDPNGIMTRTVTVPADMGASKSYVFYGDANRTGDLLQLQSMTLYGMNVYVNANLVKTITTPYFTTNVTYKIDADSKVTQVVETIKDILGNTYTSVYDLQYTTY